MQKLFIFFFCCYSFSVYSQTIPVERIVDWSTVGHVGDFMDPSNIIDFVAAGGIADGVTANDLTMQTIISNNVGTETTILFPEGNYLFNQQILLPSNFIIRGEAINTSKLLFDLETEVDCIRVLGNANLSGESIVEDVLKDTDYLIVANPSTFATDDFVYLIDDDVAKVTNAWGAGTTGQICSIKAIEGDTIIFENKIRRDFLLNDIPNLRKMNLASNVGIENLTIERLDATNSQTSNISFEFSYNCWIKCVESINCNFAHFDASYSTNTEITGCYIHDAFDFGGGGKAYGVVLHFGTGESLVYNNVFERLRHSMLLQAGANGNVLSYNYSFDPFWTGVALPSNSAGDALLHGNYPYANLYEGNIVQQMIIDNSHGINGPHNTFFRNRAELFGLFMNTNPASSSQNFIGNEIINEGTILGLYVLEGTDHFEFSNNQTGTIIPENSNNPTINSLYLDNTLDYYLSNSSWPPIGNQNEYNQFENEAKERFENGQATPCSPIISSLVPTEFLDQFKLFPNPVSQTLYIDAGDIPFDKLLVRSVLGKVVLETTNTQFDTSTFADGIYFVELRMEGKPVIISNFLKVN